MKNITTSPPAPAQSVATSQGTHTPGPWEVRHYAGKTEVRAIGDSQHMGHTWIVSDVFGDSGAVFRGHGSPAANAALIAAAPELLAALEKLAPYALQRAETEPPFTAKYARADYEIARAAIAKAKGGAQ